MLFVTSQWWPICWPKPFLQTRKLIYLLVVSHHACLSDWRWPSVASHFGFFVGISNCTFSDPSTNAEVNISIGCFSSSSVASHFGFSLGSQIVLSRTLSQTRKLIYLSVVSHHACLSDWRWPSVASHFGFLFVGILSCTVSGSIS